MRNRTVPLRLEGDEADGAAVAVQDISDPKRAAERMTTGETNSPGRSHIMEAMLSSTPDFVYAFDRQRRFVYVNPAMLALFGLSAGEMLDRNFADLGYPSELADR